MKSNSGLSFQAASLNRRSPRSGTITGSTSAPSMRCVVLLPQPDIVLPQPELRLEQLVRLAHQPRQHLDEGAAERRMAVQLAVLAVQVLLPRQEILDQLAAALGDVAQDRHDLLGLVASASASCCSAMFQSPIIVDGGHGAHAPPAAEAPERERRLPLAGRICQTGSVLARVCSRVRQRSPTAPWPRQRCRTPRCARKASYRGTREATRPGGCPGHASRAGAACEPTAPPGQSPARPVPPGPYPDLASVPPRPQLSYTVAQRQRDRQPARGRPRARPICGSPAGLCHRRCAAPGTTAAATSGRTRATTASRQPKAIAESPMPILRPT